MDYETTFTPLGEAARKLGTSEQVVLLAGFEHRINLYGLVGRRVMAMRYPIPDPDATPTAAEASNESEEPPPDVCDYPSRFALLTSMNIADLMRDGITKNIIRVDDGSDPNFMWVQASDDLAINTQCVFARYRDIAAAKESGQFPTIKPRTKPASVAPSRTLSKELRALIEVSGQCWDNADRDRSDTQPTNEYVAQKLMARGFKRSLAEAGASIIRPSWAKAGRKPVNI